MSLSQVSSLTDLISNTQIEANDVADRVIIAIVSVTIYKKGAIHPADPVGFRHYVQRSRVGSCRCTFRSTRGQ